ncbi:MAG: hypothetical protein HC930_09980 [Hydrococcus sp. SU_1_0]|nr:hypothetical protein [Hydrococcus sp. SU_1_0]NJO98996.1 hypothetical protein [Pleurocapsa sp. CRU_1_2]
MEKPRFEVDGYFGQAIRIAKKIDNPQQINLKRFKESMLALGVYSLVPAFKNAKEEIVPDFDLCIEKHQLYWRLLFDIKPGNEDIDSVVFKTRDEK